MKYTQRDGDGAWVLKEAGVADGNPAALVADIKRGLPLAEFDTLREVLGDTVEDLARRVGISVATLSRRRQSGAPLDPAHGDRLMRYARLYWLAVQLFDGDAPTAAAWLRRPAPSLAAATPLDFAETETGAREVEHLIGRLEHGVFV